MSIIVFLNVFKTKIFLNLGEKLLELCGEMYISG